MLLVVSRKKGADQSAAGTINLILEVANNLQLLCLVVSRERGAAQSAFGAINFVTLAMILIRTNSNLVLLQLSI
jgi:hypothetical protein